MLHVFFRIHLCFDRLADRRIKTTARRGHPYNTKTCNVSKVYVIEFLRNGCGIKHPTPYHSLIYWLILVIHYIVNGRSGGAIFSMKQRHCTIIIIIIRILCTVYKKYTITIDGRK